MRLIDYLDKGASLGPDAPCLTTDEADLSYAERQALPIASRARCERPASRPGDKIAVLSGNDPMAFACVFGVSRAGAVWCPINPRNEAAETPTCSTLSIAARCCSIAPTKGLSRDAARPTENRGFRVLDKARPSRLRWSLLAPTATSHRARADRRRRHDSGHRRHDRPAEGRDADGPNLEAMSAITLMSYPFEGRPVYLAFAPLTHAAGVLCLPIMTLGGRIVIMPKPDVGEFLALIAARRVTHAFLPPTVIYMLLEHPALAATDLSSLQCFWYGAAPMSPRGSKRRWAVSARDGAVVRSDRSADDDFDAGAERSLHPRRLDRARPADFGRAREPAGAARDHGRRRRLLATASAARSSCAARWHGGLLQEPAGDRGGPTFGWRHTGDIGYLDDDNYLFIVDRAKDMIITGGFNVYSIEVENALRLHPDVHGWRGVRPARRQMGRARLRGGSTPRRPRRRSHRIIAFVKARSAALKRQNRSKSGPTFRARRSARC